MSANYLNRLNELLGVTDQPSLENQLAALLQTSRTPTSRPQNFAELLGGLPSSPRAPEPASALNANGLQELFAPAANRFVAPDLTRTRRRAFFSFHYDDVMRVNNVRNAWKIDHPDRGLMRSFYDSSLWERRKLTGDASIRNLITSGVQNTSVVCVLVGSDTWKRRWVRYEIARAVVDKRGLLAVHINGLAHHKTLAPSPLGRNPLDCMGVFKSQSGAHLLYERRPFLEDELSGEVVWKWVPYRDYKGPIAVPKYLVPPSPGYVMPLSSGTRQYNFVADQGHRNIGAWIDEAAQAIGR